MAVEGIDALRGAARVGRRSSSPRTRRCRPATTASRRRSSKSTSARCANRSASIATGFMGLGRVNPSDADETFCMTVLALKMCAAPTPCRRCTARSRARCGARSIPIAARTASRSATSPTASTCRRGWRRRCARSTTATSARLGRARQRRRALGAHRRDRRRRAVGDAPDAEGAAHRHRARAARRGRPSGAASPPTWSRSSAAPSASTR